MALKVDRRINRTTGDAHSIGDIPYVDVIYEGKEYFAFQTSGTYDDLKKFHKTMIAISTGDVAQEKKTGKPQTSNPFAVMNSRGFGPLIKMVPRREVADYVWENFRKKEPPVGPLPGADEPAVEQTNLFGNRSAAAKIRKVAGSLLDYTHR